jgi:hypothetical protein
MREDFHKVVIERPRSGSRNLNRKTGWSISRSQYDRDEEYAQPIRASSSWAWYQDKHFSDRLGPLRRYLEKQVGRPWSKVEGEFRKALDTRTVIGRHLWDHARHMVELEVRMSPDGRPFHVLGGGPVGGLYVHPRSGLLLRPKPWVTDEAGARRRRLEQAKEIVLDAKTRAEKIDGFWYLFIDEGRVEEIVEVRKDNSGKMVRVTHTRDVIRKKQASTREIERIRELLDKKLR